MTNAQRQQQTNRDTILKLLTNEETARVSTAETAAGLADGAEYLDLEHLELGVQSAKTAAKVTMGHVLARSAVSSETWAKILAQLNR
jgi:hypothetical protein